MTVLRLLSSAPHPPQGNSGATTQPCLCTGQGKNGRYRLPVTNFRKLRVETIQMGVPLLIDTNLLLSNTCGYTYSIIMGRIIEFLTKFV